jgi:hypothetical protein
MRRPAPKPPSALRPLQRKEGAASEQQPIPGVRLAAAVAARIALSLAAGVATMITGLEAAPRLHTNTLAVIIVTEVYVLLIVSLLAASGGWSAAVQTFGLRVQRCVVLAGVLLAGALSVAALVGYAVVGAWAPLVEELVWVGRDGGWLGSLAPATTAVTLRGTLLAALGEELLFRGALFGWLCPPADLANDHFDRNAVDGHARRLAGCPAVRSRSGSGIGMASGAHRLSSSRGFRARNVSPEWPFMPCTTASCSSPCSLWSVGDERVTPAHRARSGWAAAAPAPTVSVGPLILVQRLKTAARRWR